MAHGRFGVAGGVLGLGEGVEVGVGQDDRAGVLGVAQGGAAVRAGDEAGLEALVRAHVDLQVAEAGDGRQVEGVGGVEDGAGLVGGEGAQAEPVGEVGVQALELAALDALAGEQQVHADGAADAADGQEEVDEVRLGGEQFAELVDDDEEVRQRVEVGPGLAQGGVVADVGDVAGVLEDLLAALDLAGEGGVDALDEAGLVLEVGDDAGDVRQVGEGREGGAALVVDEDHGEVLGRVGGHQGEDEGAQELALAGAGGADAQAVRAHAELGAFLEVEEDGFAAVADADGHAQEGAFAARLPQGAHVEGGRVVDAEELGEVHGSGQRRVDEGLGGQAQRGEQSGQALGAGGGGLVDGAPGGDGFGGAQVLDVDLVAVDGDAQGDVAGLLDALGDQVQHGDAHVLQGHGLVGPRQFGRVLAVLVADDEEPAGHLEGFLAGQTAAHLGGVGGAGAQVAAHEPGQLAEGGGDAAGADGPVVLLRVEGVGQPLEPGPVLHPVAGAGEGEGDVVGGVGDGGLGEQGAGDAQDALALADDADVADAVEGHGQRQVGRGGEAVLQRPGLVEHEAVGRGEDAAALLADRQGPYGHPAGAHAHAQEVGVEAAALPQPGGVAHEVVERLGRRVEDPGDLAALALLGAELLAELLEVLEVALALLAAGALGLAALRQQHADRADDGDDQHDRAESGELAVADDRHHDDGAHHARDRHEAVQGAARLALGQVGRRLDGARLGGRQGPGGPGGAVDYAGGHRVLRLLVEGRRPLLAGGRLLIGGCARVVADRGLRAVIEGFACSWPG